MGQEETQSEKERSEQNMGCQEPGTLVVIPLRRWVFLWVSLMLK